MRHRRRVNLSAKMNNIIESSGSVVFRNRLGVRISTLIESNFITINVGSTPTYLSVTAGEYYTKDTGWTSASSGPYKGIIRVAVRQLSPDYHASPLQTTILLVGEKSYPFGITTRPDTSIPNPFSIAPVTDADINVLVTSAPTSVTGIGESTSISITGGSYRLNGIGDFTTASSKFSQGDTFEVQLGTSSEFGQSTEAIVTVGGVFAIFTATTAAEYSNYSDLDNYLDIGHYVG